MDISERIDQKERMLSLMKTHKDIFFSVGQIKLAKEQEEEIEDLKKSIEHDREVQKLEAIKSGRKTFKEDALKYVGVIIVTVFAVELIRFIFSNL